MGQSDSSRLKQSASSTTAAPRVAVTNRSQARVQQSSKADRALSIITAGSKTHRSLSSGERSRVETSRVASVQQDAESVDEIRDASKALNLSLVEPQFTLKDTVVPDRSDQNAVPRGTSTNVLKPNNVAAREVVDISKPRFNDRLQASVGARNVDSAVENSPTADAIASTKTNPVTTAERHDVGLNNTPVNKSELPFAADQSAELARIEKSVSPDIVEPPTLGAALPTKPADNIEPETVVGEALSSRPTTVGENPVTVVSALKLPNDVIPRQEKFSYVEAIPASYDIGGGGVLLSGSAESHSRFHYVGRIGVANTYQELRVGGGYYLTPASADRFTVMLEAGVEHGVFNLNDEHVFSR